MEIKQALLALANKKDVSEDLLMKCFDDLFQGKLTPSQAGAFLFGLKTKGETHSELFPAVTTALKYAVKVDVTDIADKTIDTCGTGGDGKMSFNCSTAVALYLADMGYKVVKHGNKGVSSKCGSADILEEMGIPFLKEPMEIKSFLNNRNFVFLFAPFFHPAFKYVAPVRIELGIPTIFNVMGPLLNPANPTHQLLGVGDKKYMDTMAKVLQLKGIKRAAVVHGDGFDEITPTGETQVILIEENNIKKFTITPEEFEIKRCSEQDLKIKDKNQSLEIMKLLFEGNAPQPIKDMVALNLGMALYLLNENMRLKDAVKSARQRIDKGLKKGRSLFL